MTSQRNPFSSGPMNSSYTFHRLAWAHDFGDTPQASAIFQALPGSSFSSNASILSGTGVVRKTW